MGWGIEGEENGQVVAGEDLVGEDIVGEDLVDQLAGDDLAGEDLVGEDLVGEDLVDQLAGDDLAGEVLERERKELSAREGAFRCIDDEDFHVGRITRLDVLPLNTLVFCSIGSITLPLLR